jgi:predicted MFS family arabinose efflux permease
MFPASVIGGWLWDHISPSATFYFGAITASLSAILFVVFIAVVRRNSYAK